MDRKTGIFISKRIWVKPLQKNNYRVLLAISMLFFCGAFFAGKIWAFDGRADAVLETHGDTASNNEAERQNLSLNFQQIQVRTALQIIADFANLNLVISDDVEGVLSLRLDNVPWRQALNAILKSKDLALREADNLFWIAPIATIINREQKELQAQQQKIELEPQVSEIISLRYARAEKIITLVQSVLPTTNAQGNAVPKLTQSTPTDSSTRRDVISYDERTNSLLIQGTVARLTQIKNIIKQIDIPLRQVEIETRIVEAQDGFSKSIGARLGFTQIRRQTPSALFANSTASQIATGRIENARSIQRSGVGSSINDALSINLPAESIGGDPASSYNFSISKLGASFINLIDLELSALQADGKGRVLANPKILTTDKRRASISQGQERLSVFSSAFGTASSEGQSATLGLTVFPQITPDNEIILDVQITNDSFVSATSDAVNTKRIDTQALLKDGETVIIGGIYTQEQSNSVTKVPLLGDIPYIKHLFRKQSSYNARSELLIFLTPRIID